MHAAPVRAHRVLPAGGRDAGQEADGVPIALDRRRRRRILPRTEGGRDAPPGLPRGGDWAGAGRRRRGARLRPAEPLPEIHAHDPAESVRVAWHLGNRHVPVRLMGARIRADRATEGPVRSLGGHGEDED